MGYKQSPFPMQQGTSSHTSAVKHVTARKHKHVEGGSGSYNKEGEQTGIETHSKRDEKRIAKKERKQIRKDTNEQISKAQKATDMENVHIKNKEKEEKLIKKKEKKYEKASTNIDEKEPTGRDKRKAERKALKEKKKSDRANETLEERKKRRKKNREGWIEDMDPVLRAMDQPRSTTAKGYFDDEIKKEKRSKKSKRKKAARKKTISVQAKVIREQQERLNKYAGATADNADNKKEETE